MKQVQIYANFAVDDNLDPELLLEVIEAVTEDVLSETDVEGMMLNYGGVIHSVEVNCFSDNHTFMGDEK